MSIQFEGHKGTLDIETNEVTFYDMVFTSILDAAKFLKGIPVGPEYTAWYYRRHRGLLNEDDGSVYLKDRWLPDEEFAMELINTGYK